MRCSIPRPTSPLEIVRVGDAVARGLVFTVAAELGRRPDASIATAARSKADRAARVAATAARFLAVESPSQLPLPNKFGC